MRPLYILLKVTLPLAYSVYFKQRKLVNAPKKTKARTIFVSNHPSAFLDPPLIASLGRPIVFFMTRSDVFKWWLKPVTWACHMVPIYRAAQDGAGTYEKNQQVFSGIQKVLRKGGSLIMFGEGYTDDIFIRSLKPMKKGPPRIGFGTMVASDWKLDIIVQPVGVNYSNPNAFRSHVVVKYSDPIRLLDYKEMFEENPNKATLQLMRKIGEEIQKNITYLEDKSKADFLEHLMILNRKGMNHEHYDKNLGLVERMDYSHALARRINEEFTEDAEDWKDLKESTDNYFKALKQKKTKESFVHTYGSKGGKDLLMNWLSLLLTLPIFLLGTVHNTIPYFFTKVLIEKMFKRKVFWSGVKLMLGGLMWILVNLPIFWLFPTYIYPELGLDNVYMEFAVSMLYLLAVIPFSFVVWHWWGRRFKSTFQIMSTSKKDLQELSEKRSELLAKMESMSI